MRFTLTPEDARKIQEWQRTLHPNGAPYGGAAGGALTYSFTPTSLGVAAKVYDEHSKQTLDLEWWRDW